MAGSSDERAIRDAVHDWLRVNCPQARVIHELVVGGCRADLAAVETERVVLFEIKSRKDKLERLPEQVRQFSRAAHETVVVADERWFDRTPYTNGADRFVPSAALQAGADHCPIWAYPETRGRRMYGAWSFNRWSFERPQPHAARLLELLWKEELLRECFRHQISATSRTTCPVMIRDMAWHMSGKEIARAVCRQLRQRSFPEADQPILEAA